MKMILILVMLLGIIGCNGSNTNTNTNSTSITISIGVPEAPVEEEEIIEEELPAGMQFSNNGGTKDLEKLAAQKEQNRIGINAAYYVSNFGLSNEVAYANAESVYAFNMAKKNGNCDTRELDILSMEVLGVDSTTLKNAYEDKIEGDNTSYKLMIEQAAERQGISTEHMGSIINEIL